MSKKFYIFILLIFSFVSKGESTELLLKDGTAFLVEDIIESGSSVIFSWKERKYKIPKVDIQRVDPRKKGPDSSYRYSEFQLSDGTVLRGILVEKKDSKLILKTELGFAELDKSKIVSGNEEDLTHTAPILPEKYLDTTGQGGEWRVGVSALGLASLGVWRQVFPFSAGVGFFLEKNHSSGRVFYGFSSEFSSGPGKGGQYSIWSQGIYLGKSYGVSSPYWLFGVGASSISRTDGQERISALTPDTTIEFGWAWETNSKHTIRLGIRSQCNWEGESTLCRSGLRFSWGFYL